MCVKMNTKICNKCKKRKHLSNFYRWKYSKEGITSYCKKCIKILRKKYIKSLKGIKVLKIYRETSLKYKKYQNRYNKKKYKLYKSIIKEYNKIQYLKHKQKRLIYAKKYNRTPEGIYNCLKTRAKTKNIKVTIKKEDFINWYNLQNKECHYCKRNINQLQKDKKETNKYYKNRLSIDRKDNNKGYTLDNIILACCRCNCNIKSNYFDYKETIILGKLLQKIYKKRQYGKSY